MQSFQKYAPQIGSSCTPASIMYAVVVLETNTPAICSEDAMQIIMDNASALYKTKTRESMETFLQQCEVMEHLGMYARYTIRELFATNSIDLTDFPKECIDYDDIWLYLLPNSCMIITCNKHTTAVVEKDGAYHFDPIVASVQPIRHKKDLIDSIVRAHGTSSPEMTINVVVPKPIQNSSL